MKLNLAIKIEFTYPQLETYMSAFFLAALLHIANNTRAVYITEELSRIVKLIRILKLASTGVYQEHLSSK